MTSNKVVTKLQNLPGVTRDEIKSMLAALNAIDNAYDAQDTRVATSLKAVQHYFEEIEAASLKEITAHNAWRKVRNHGSVACTLFMDPFNYDQLPVKYELPFWRINKPIDSSDLYSCDPIVVMFERELSDRLGDKITVADICCSDV